MLQGATSQRIGKGPTAPTTKAQQTKACALEHSLLPHDSDVNEACFPQQNWGNFRGICSADVLSDRRRLSAPASPFKPVAAIAPRAPVPSSGWRPPWTKRGAWAENATLLGRRRWLRTLATLIEALDLVPDLLKDFASNNLLDALPGGKIRMESLSQIAFQPCVS